VSRTGALVSGSLAYPAFLHGLLTVAGPGLRGFPSASASRGRSRERQPSNDLIVSFRALLGTLEPPCVGSSSRGIGVPAADVPPARPLRGAEAPVGPASPGADSRSVLVVSHHLDGFLRVGVAGLLHPATGQGFTAFRACRQGGRPKAASMPGTVPAVRFAPFEEFPSSAAGHASLRPLPSCRYRPARRGVPAEAGVRRPRSPLTRGAYPRGADLGTGAVSGLRRAPRAGVPGTTKRGSEEPRWSRPALRGAWAPRSRAPKSRCDRVPRGVRRSEEGRALLGDAGALPCREGARRLRGAGGSEPSWEAGGRGSEQLRHQIPARGRNSGWGGSGGTGTGRRGSEEPRRRCSG
jgi:hypothetical protein